jgi:Ca2+-binding RTX toxin-like protein
LGSTALTSSAVYASTGAYLSSVATSVSANTSTYLFNGESTTNASIVDTLANIQNVTGTNGADYIVGSDAVNVITGGAGVDTITGGAGADVFVIAAGDSSTTTAIAVSDVITDFATTSDTLKVGTAGSSTNYAEVLTAVADLTTLLTAANTALNGTILYYFGVIGTNGYLITDDATSAGANNVIQLTGVTDMAYGDIIA